MRTGAGRAPRDVPALALLALAALVSGCLSSEVPPTASSGPLATPVPSPSPRKPGELVVMVPTDPQGFLLPAEDDTTQLLVDLLYDPLYRLDEHLRPQPDLASDLPQISTDGLTWQVPLRTAGFSDGTGVTAGDVAYSLGLAASPACPYGRDLCSAAFANVASTDAPGKDTLTITLRQPFGPFLTEVLGQLPVLSKSAVVNATRALVSGAAGIDSAEPGRQVDTITDATNQESCLADQPPFGCRLSDYISTLEKLLGDARVALPAKERYLEVTGGLDEEAYGGALLDRVAALGTVLTSTGIDQQAAALPMLDPVTAPLGSGPYHVQAYTPGSSIELAANPEQAGGAPAIGAITLRVMRDAAVAATSLISGDADWLLRVDDSQLAAVQAATGVVAGIRPLPLQRLIVFNVREGRVYATPATRQAFAMCLDRAALVQQSSGGQELAAATPTAWGSWAMQQPSPSARNVAGAIKQLQDAGWTRGSDGIFAKGGMRLSSEIAVRQSRADLFAFASSAAQQLSECGIELKVRELDLTGDLLISQLQWPNAFDTVLISQDLGVDPDQDIQAFEGAHATSAENPADANPGGYISSNVDGLIEDARKATDLTSRATLYASLQERLATDLPAWPIWYDGAASAVTTRVLADGKPLDPTQPRFWWHLEGWSLAGG